MSQVAIELPYVLIQALVYGLIVYAMIGFEWTAAKFFWYIFFMYFTFLYFTFYGMMAVAVTPNHHIASIVSSAFYAIWNLFSGFVIPRPVCDHLLCYRLLGILRMALLIYRFVPFSEYAGVVEMVLLGMSCCLDVEWVGYFTVWRCEVNS